MTDRDVNRDVIARRIKALQAKTVEAGCTEEEAMAAAAKVAELMAAYRLTQSDLEIEQEPIDKREVRRRQREKAVSEDSCLSGIQRLCGVKCWFTWGFEGSQKVKKVVFFGLRADCDHAEWLYRMIGPTIMAAAEGFKQASRGDYHSLAAWRQAITDFRMGMSTRINQRLIDMVNLDAQTASGTALVVVRNPLVERAYAELGLHLRRGNAGKRFSTGDAYARGRVAGDAVNLRRPVGHAAYRRLS